MTRSDETVIGGKLRRCLCAARPFVLNCRPLNALPWNIGCAARPPLTGWCGVREQSCVSRMDKPSGKSRASCSVPDKQCACGSRASFKNEWAVWTTCHVLAARSLFPPVVATHLVKLACERPDKLGCSLSQWDCEELARELFYDQSLC